MLESLLLTSDFISKDFAIENLPTKGISVVLLLGVT